MIRAQPFKSQVAANLSVAPPTDLMDGLPDIASTGFVSQQSTRGLIYCSQ